MKRLRRIANLLVLSALAGCGAPGSDSVFTRNKPEATAADSPSAKSVPPPTPRIETKLYAGYYRKLGDDSQFLPCGTTRLLEITGTPLAMLLLKERFRWNAIWEGAKLFAVFRGAIVTDTVRSDSANAGPRTRFFLVDVDSMRTWRNGDCNGMRTPRVTEP